MFDKISAAESAIFPHLEDAENFLAEQNSFIKKFEIFDKVIYNRCIK